MKRRLLIGCVLTLATASIASAEQNHPDVRLIEPANHASLVAGSTVPIAWEATKLPPDVDEWEAFVSIDDGRTYPIRITPHLDAGIRRFEWTVPFLPAAKLSILLRLGNEREERQFSFPARGVIRGTAPLEMFRTEIGRTISGKSEERWDHGERLIEWVDGSREGTDLKRRGVDSSRLGGNFEWNSCRDGTSQPAIGSTSKGILAVAERPLRSIDPADLQRIPGRQPEQRCAGILTLTRRLNT